MLRLVSSPLWANRKGTELANLAGEPWGEIIAAAESGRLQRIRATPQLPFLILRHWNQRPASARPCG